MYTPGRHSPLIGHTPIQGSLFKWFEQTHASVFPAKSHIMQIKYHFDATMLNYKQFAVFSKYSIATCVRQKMVTSDQLFKFVFRQDWRLSTRFPNWNHQNVTRMFQEHMHVIDMVILPTVAWLIRLVCGWSIRITEKLKSARDGIDCDWRRTVREVAEMTGISKYTICEFIEFYRMFGTFI